CDGADTARELSIPRRQSAPRRRRCSAHPARRLLCDAGHRERASRAARAALREPPRGRRERILCRWPDQEVIADLVNIDALRVFSRATAMRYRADRRDATLAARELGARY